MSAVVVVEEHLAARADRATENVPRIGDQLRTLGEEFGIRAAAGGDHHHVGVLGEHLVGLGVGVGPDVDVEQFALGQPPVDDADQVAPPRRR